MSLNSIIHQPNQAYCIISICYSSKQNTWKVAKIAPTTLSKTCHQDKFKYSFVFECSLFIAHTLTNVYLLLPLLLLSYNNNSLNLAGISVYLLERAFVFVCLRVCKCTVAPKIDEAIRWFYCNALVLPNRFRLTPYERKISAHNIS